MSDYGNKLDRLLGLKTNDEMVEEAAVYSSLFNRCRWWQIIRKYVLCSKLVKLFGPGGSRKAVSQ